MQPRLSTYLTSLRGYLRTGAATRSSILGELADHLEDRTDELMKRGFTREEAWAEASRRFGDPEAIGTELTLVHNQGTWIVAGLTAAPHLLAAALFASHRWLELQLLVPALVLMAAVSALGWWRRLPTWVYPWIGYLLFPFLLAGTVSTVTLGYAVWSIIAHGGSPTDPWIWAFGGFLGIAGVALSGYLLIWVSRRDWVQASLLVLPVPALAVALFAYGRGEFPTLAQADSQAAVLMIFVAAVSAIVIRLADRLLKITLITAALPIGFLLTTQALEPGTRLLLAFVLSLPALLLVLAPNVVSAASTVAARRASR